MTTNKSYLAWVAATSLGLCVGFLAILQVIMLIKYRQLSWMGGILSGMDGYLALFVGLLVGGAILGATQSVVTRSYDIPVTPWILATAAGFGAMSAVIIPLLHIEVWGNIPGPIFMTLEGPLGIFLNWPAQIALTGFLIGGFGALFSGQTFLKTLPGR